MAEDKTLSDSIGIKETEATSADPHPSRNLQPRARGYGIGGGFEKPYRKRITPADQRSGSYGPVPHSGYYGAGAGAERFQRGEAGFKKELEWYGPQYGEKTSGQNK
jgi:hypothetical protein